MELYFLDDGSLIIDKTSTLSNTIIGKRGI